MTIREFLKWFTYPECNFYKLIILTNAGDFIWQDSFETYLSETIGILNLHWHVFSDNFNYGPRFLLDFEMGDVRMVREDIVYEEIMPDVVPEFSWQKPYKRIRHYEVSLRDFPTISDLNAYLKMN